MKKEKVTERKLIFDQKGLELFALQLKKVRKEAGISQNQLAFESGVSLSQIARIETAKINPTLSTIFSIARALEIPLSKLFDFQLSDNETHFN